MPEGIRPETRYAASLAIIALFPASVDYSLAMLLFIGGIAAVLILWYQKAYLLLGLSLVSSTLATTLIFGISKGLFLMIGFAFPALTIALLRRRGWGMAATLGIALLPPVVAMVISYPFWRELVLFMTDELKLTAASSEFTRIYSSAELKLFVDYVNWMADTLLVLFPSLLISLTTAILGVGTLLGNYLIRRSGMFAVPVRSFILWKAPEAILIPMALAVIFVLTEVEILAIIGWNVLFVTFLLYSVCGLSLLEYLVRRFKVPLPVKVLVYLVLFLTQVVAAVGLPLAALFDSHFDFRRVRAKQIG